MDTTTIFEGVEVLEAPKELNNIKDWIQLHRYHQVELSDMLPVIRLALKTIKAGAPEVIRLGQGIDGSSTVDQITEFIRVNEEYIDKVGRAMDAIKAIAKRFTELRSDLDKINKVDPMMLFAHADTGSIVDAIMTGLRLQATSKQVGDALVELQKTWEIVSEETVPLTQKVREILKEGMHYA